MAGRIDARLQELGISLPEAPAPAGNYVGWVQSGRLVYISGQVSRTSDGLLTGKLGADVSLEAGQAAARSCALYLLTHLKEACGGDLDRVTRVVKLNGFVNAAPDFADHPSVVNGASDLMGEVFGDQGRHARAAVGCGSLPLNVSVEVEGIFEVA